MAYNVFGIRSQLDCCPFWMFSLKQFCDDVSIRYSSHARKTVILSFASVNLVAVFFDGSFGSFKLGAATTDISGAIDNSTRHSRIEVNGILVDSTTATASTDPNGRPLGPYLPTLQVLYQYFLKLPDGLVVILNQVRKLPNPSSNMHTRRGIWNTKSVKDSLDAFVGLELLRYTRDL